MKQQPFVIAVCDGSEMVKAMQISFRHQREAEDFVRENLSAYGERLFWVAADREMTIGEMTALVSEIPTIGYMIDDGALHRCQPAENGNILWEEVDL